MSRSASAHAAPRPGRPSAPSGGRSAQAARIERRRRRRHLQQLRRDFAADIIAAVVLTIFVFVVTAGLGVVAILELLAGTALIATSLLERRRRRRRRPRQRPRASTHASSTR